MTILRVYGKRNGISRCDQEKILFNFHKPSFLALELSRGVTQFYGIFKGKALFYLDFLGVKCQVFFYVLKTPCLDLLWNSPVIISCVTVIVQVLTNKWKSKFKTKIQQVYMIWPILRSIRDHFFKKGFRKLDFSKIVSIKIIADSEKMRMKKSHPPSTFAFPLPCTFWFPIQVFLKIAPPTHFLEISFLPFKKGGGRGGGENYVYSSKNLYNNIWL